MFIAGQLTPPVMITFVIAVVISVGSLYYAHRYLPRKIDRAYKNSLYALAAAVETKDSGTIGHAKRVADHSVAVARTLGVAPEEIRWIEYAALLRDIGKANIPQMLLNKSEPLDPEEWERVKSHSTFGAEIVSSVTFLSQAAELVLYHHEQWDGTGYPEGLAQEGIPLGARIIAVADDYDALVSDRPYHKAQSLEEAEIEVKRGSGTKYDPAVVEAFVRVLNQEKGRV